ncbi:MAG: hypothetical protein IPM16_17840 [Chloroflexi bacterium]|nr:hypothetical protein [Chloroflexota bacterium]
MTENPISAVEKARRQFSEAGLPFPPVPASLAEKLAKISDWYYSTNPDITEKGELALFELLQRDTLPDYALLAQVGHGINSWAIRCTIVFRPLVLLLEYPWGGALMDNEYEATSMRKRFDAAAKLIDAVQQARADGRLGAHDYFVVIDNSLIGSQWLKLKVPSDTHPLKMQWTTSDDVLADVLTAL